TTMPHLHFEVHPRTLLHLHYDGAVNPTRYLESWPRPGKLHAPHPVHPRLPRSATWRYEAAVNFRELLAASGLLGQRGGGAPPPILPPVRALDPMTPAPPTVGRRTDATFAWAGGAGLAALAGSALGFALWRRRQAAPQ